MAADTCKVEVGLSKRKEAARLFEEAVSLDNPKTQIKLYERIIKLDPAHTEARNKLADLYNALACLYFECKSINQYEREDNRDKAREYYKRAIALGHVGAKGNLRCLNLQIQSELVKEYQSYGHCYEKGAENNGITNPNGAIIMYKHAINKNEKWIALLKEAESDNCHLRERETKKISRKV